MIELPEANVLSRQVKNTLLGKRIVHVQANASPHKFAWYTGDPAQYPEWLSGKTIRETCTFGNFVQLWADDLRLVISTPMRYHAQGENPPKKHHLYIKFEDGSALSCTVQMWGAMLCLREGEEAGMADVTLAMQKPALLEDSFDREYFESLLAAGYEKLSAKAFLATEQRIPGLGNGMLQDILWAARIHPRRQMGDLSVHEMEGLYAAVKGVPAAMTGEGGRDTETDLFGRPGGYRTRLCRKTLGKPCPACGAPLEKQSYMGGSVYICPGCQPI